MVTFAFILNVTGSTPTSQGLRISGFPFANNSSVYAFFPCGGVYKPGNSTSKWDEAIWRMDKDGTTARVLIRDTNVLADGDVMWTGSNDEYRHEISGTYMITI